MSKNNKYYHAFILPMLKEILKFMSINTDPYKNPPIINYDSDTAIFKGNGVNLILNNYSIFSEQTKSTLVKTTDYMLLILLLIEFESNGRNNETLCIKKEKYMQIRELKKANKAYAQIAHSLNILSNLSYEICGKVTAIGSCLDTKKSQTAKFIFSEELFNKLTSARSFTLTNQIFSLHPRKFPNAFYFGLTLDYQRSLPKKQRPISVEELLLSSPLFSYKNLRTINHDRCLNKIISPCIKEANEVTTASIINYSDYFYETKVDDEVTKYESIKKNLRKGRKRSDKSTVNPYFLDCTIVSRLDA